MLQYSSPLLAFPLFIQHNWLKIILRKHYNFQNVVFKRCFAIFALLRMFDENFVIFLVQILPISVWLKGCGFNSSVHQSFQPTRKGICNKSKKSICGSWNCVWTCLLEHRYKNNKKIQPELWSFKLKGYLFCIFIDSRKFRNYLETLSKNYQKWYLQT